MKRSELSHIDPFAEVTKEALYTSEGKQSSRQAVILDPEGVHQEVGVVSQDYQLMPNREVAEIAEDILRRSGLEYTLAKHLFDGKHFRQRWIVPSLNAEPEVGDLIQVAVDVSNSYDGTSSFGLSFNAQRLVCTNGMVLDFLLGGFRFRHYGNENFQEELSMAAQSIRELGPKMLQLAPSIKRMMEEPVSRYDIQTIFSEIQLPKTYIADVFMQLDGDTEWSLYNAFTGVLTMQDSFRAETWNRQISRYFFKGK
jgi:hypothetical protein